MAGTTRVDLLSNAAVGNGADQIVQAGKYGFIVDATFTGGSVTLEMQDPKGTYIPLSIQTGNGMVVLELPAGTYRAVAAGAVAVASAWLVTIPTITTR